MGSSLLRLTRSIIWNRNLLSTFWALLSLRLGAPSIALALEQRKRPFIT